MSQLYQVTNLEREEGNNEVLLDRTVGDALCLLSKQVIFCNGGGIYLNPDSEIRFSILMYFSLWNGVQSFIMGSKKVLGQPWKNHIECLKCMNQNAFLAERYY